MAKSDDKLVDIDAELHMETPKAYLIHDGKRKAWVPKEHTERNPDGTFTMPEWLAQSKELI